MVFVVYWRECVRCGCAICITEAERNIDMWLCPTCGNTKQAEPLTEGES